MNGVERHPQFHAEFRTAVSERAEAAEVVADDAGVHVEVQVTGDTVPAWLLSAAGLRGLELTTVQQRGHLVEVWFA